MLLIERKKGQLAVFVIIAIAIVASVLVYFLLREKISIVGVPADFKQVEEHFSSCLEDYTKAGISLLGEQAGYIYVPDFVPGSAYMPSSNQLDFLGSGIPYWYYVSGNNIVKEQMPGKKEMEKQLGKYLEENLACDFSSFFDKGFSVSVGEAKADVKISNNRVDVNLKANLEMGFDEESSVKSEHKKSVESSLGKLYNEAVKIYNKEKTEMFLEKYALDVLYLYAPVDSVELSCSPKIWSLENVKKDVKLALEENIITIGMKRKYFDLGLSNARFLYSKEWATKIETQDSEGMLVAEPVGNQQGLGILGFCYVPYHFVYDVVFPVLIQLYDGREIFQFPVAVIIQGNKERNALPGSYIGEAEPETCKYKNADVNVYTYNTNLEPVEADISFKCFNEVCDIGKTKIENKEAFLSGKFPQCVNGFVIAKADNYEEKKEMLSTNRENSVNVILDRLYDVGVSVKIGNREINDMAIIYFESEDTLTSVVWPEQKSVRLTEGLYNVSVYVYSNTTIRIQGTKTQKCIESVKPGFLGFFGAKEEKCFDLEIPSQDIQNGIIGGGKAEQYATESELEKGKVEIFVEALPVPKSLEDLQKNYELLEGKNVYLEFGK